MNNYCECTTTPELIECWRGEFESEHSHPGDPGRSEPRARFVNRVLPNYDAPAKIEEAASVARGTILAALALYCFSGCAVKRVPRATNPDQSKDVVAFERPSIYCIDLGRVHTGSDVHVYRCPVPELKKAK